jgi:uncharacterized membrane protein (DUF4010 family)
MYALVLFALAVVKDQMGNQGLYAVAALSGLTDMDAITMSIAQMTRQPTVASDQGIDSALAWRLIVVASIANLAFKAGIVAVFGSQRLTRYVVPLFALPAAAGGLMLLLWKDTF